MAQQINLYRVEFRTPTKIFSSVHMFRFGLAALVMLVLVAGSFVYRTAVLRSQVAQYEEQQGAMQDSLSELSKRFIARAGDPALMNEVAKLETLLNAPDAVRQMLASDSFGGTEGYSDYFVAFARRSLSEMWLTGVEIVGAGSQVTLRGRAVVPERVPQYLQRLAAEKKLAGKEFELFQMTRPQLESTDSEGSTRSVAANYIEFVVKTKDESKPEGQP